jgi:SsrA-binding protein
MKNNSVNIQNRKASHDYFFEKKLTAGITLKGSEVKSIRDGRVNFVDSYCAFQEGELFLKNLHISVLKYTNPHAEKRDRKLLLKKSELNRLQKELVAGYTIVPLGIHESQRGFLKVDIALARGKKNYDKRDSLKEKDIKRETDRALEQ